MFGISKVPSFFNITLLNKNVGFSVYSVLARPSSAYYKNDLSQVYRGRYQAIYKKKKVCPICPNNIIIDYKDGRLLSQFLSDASGRILPSSVTGTCRASQRKLAKAIRKARAVGLLAFTYKLPQYFHEK
ncbi:small ribosomal subunit protein bS18-like [Zophobas morio]|uniref:small ribosomal subunit protein bS18-like n=1 Tax=Zophobas morio TaxID=2755281 RepID=UPI0030834168